MYEKGRGAAGAAAGSGGSFIGRGCVPRRGRVATGGSAGREEDVGRGWSEDEERRGGFANESIPPLRTEEERARVTVNLRDVRKWWQIPNSAANPVLRILPQNKTRRSWGSQGRAEQHAHEQASVGGVSQASPATSPSHPRPSQAASVRQGGSGVSRSGGEAKAHEKDEY